MYTMGYYSALENNGIISFATMQMDIEIIILSEVRERQIPYDITQMWNLKYDTNGPIYETEIEAGTQKIDQWLPSGGGGKGLYWEFGVSRCKLVYTEWINNKVILYTTGNYIQYPVINHSGKNMKKNVYVCLSHFAAQQ